VAVGSAHRHCNSSSDLGPSFGFLGGERREKTETCDEEGGGTEEEKMTHHVSEICQKHIPTDESQHSIQENVLFK
jgi:hypothetical protein